MNSVATIVRAEVSPINKSQLKDLEGILPWEGQAASLCQPVIYGKPGYELLRAYYVATKEIA